MGMKLAVIIPAAGASSRYLLGGAGDDPTPPVRSKLDEDLGGRPVVQRTVELFTAVEGVCAIIVAGPADPERMRAFEDRHGDRLRLLGCRIVAGGAEHRAQTVARALEQTPSDATHVCVHDAARPCTPPEVIRRVLAAALEHDAVIPGVAVADTLKRVGPERVSARVDPLAAVLGGTHAGGPPARPVEATIDRDGLVGVQTPQVFGAELLRRAYRQPDLRSTDDAQLVERLGEPVVVVQGDPRNIKITRWADVVIARAILGLRGPEGRATHMRF